MGKGKTYELEIKNTIMEETTDEVVALRPDFSGNSLHSVSDVCIVWPDYSDGRARGAFVEMKKRSADAGKRTTVMAGSKNNESGLDELEGLLDGTPPWADPWIMVKFDRREAIIAHAELFHTALIEGDTDIHGARLTPSDNVSMVKPTLDEWRSSTAGEDDYIKLLTTVGVSPKWIDPFTIEVDTSVGEAGA